MSRVVEVLPVVALTKLHQTPEYFAGLFNYRSEIVPMIDICQILQGYSCRPFLSTRIIIVHYLIGERPSSFLAILAERVTEITDYSDNKFVDSGININQSRYRGKIIIDEQGIIQCVRVESLLPESQSHYLMSNLAD
ncbi:chemotaxis protein CheW [Microcoleus sp. FACHB-68]|uniref:chemotaxis protein CheW n=1 Tax=Microcoleus sp. FACHB-68 TaxID=2692826 RepID=UPI00321FEB7B